MCTLMKTSEMPEMKNGRVVKNETKKFIALFPKPNKEGENYRLRLLWYKQSTKNDRKTPYFFQMVHDHWGETENGKKIIDDVVICPGTKYVHYDEEKFLVNSKTGQKYLNCPICMKSVENFAIAKSSGWKDKLATKRGFSLKAKFRGIVPVYVVNDPNNEKNNGQLKVLIFTNKDEFERFDTLVNEEKSKAYLASKEGNGYEIFNGENGVDFYLHMDQVEELKNEGKLNEYKATVRKITGMKFGNKAYNIPTITKDLINAFEMDDQYYISNTKEELEEFYHKYYGYDIVDVPDEEVDLFTEDKTDTEAVKPEDTINKSFETKQEAPTVTEEYAQDVISNVEEVPLPPPEPSQDKSPLEYVYPPEDPNPSDGGVKQLSDKDLDDIINL